MILNSPTISGSLTVTGNIITSGSITISGSIASASYATNAELLDGLDSTAFATTGAYSATSASLYATSASLSATSGSLSATSGSLSATSGSLSATSGSLSTASGSFNTRVTALEVTGSALSSSLLTVSGSGYATSGSLSTASGSFDTRVATIESKYATTGSNTFTSTQVVSGSILQSGSFTTTGTIIAQTINVQTVTSSVVYSSGSNVFGNSIGNSQTFTGSVLITGSLTIAGNITSNGAAFFAGAVCVSNIISTGTSGGRYGTFNAPTNGGYITFEAGGTAFGDLGSYCAQYGTGDATTLLLGSRTGYALALGSNSTERLRITCAGNVGIGTCSPSYKLQVNGASGTIARITDGTNNLDFYAGSSLNEIAATTSLLLSTNGATRLTIACTGAATFSGDLTIGGTANTQSSLSLTRLKGYSNYYDASNRYGDYGKLIFNADSSWTSAARRWLITNAVNNTTFAIIRSDDSTTDPSLGNAGAVDSGTVDFQISNAGAATFSNNLTLSSASSVLDVGGVLYVRGNGSACATHDFNTGAANVALYQQRNAAGTVINQFNAGGTSYFNSGCNVGIGTSSPDPYGFGYTSLTIRGGTYAGAAGMLHLITPTTDSNGQILGQINFNDGVNLGAAISSRRETSNTTSNIQFYTNNCTITEKMRITSAGNVGIGTCSPSATLHIVSPVVSAGTALKVVSDGNSNDKVFEFTGADGVASQSMYMFQSGNVGIGTCVPSQQLSFGMLTNSATRTYTTDNQGTLSFYNLTTGNLEAYLDIASVRTGNDDTLGGANIRFLTQTVCSITSACERMRITSSGQVAIGATSNLNNFTIKSSSDTITSGGLSFQSRTAVTNYIAMGLNSSNDFEIQTWTTPSWITRMYIKNNGNIGIGTCSPSEKLHLYNSTAATTLSLVIENSINNYNSQINFKSIYGGSTARSYLIGSNISIADGSWEVYDATVAAARLVITNDGTMLVGGASSSGAYNLSLGNATANTYYQVRSTNTNSLYGSDTRGTWMGNLSGKEAYMNASTFVPGVDNSTSLGTSSYRWSVVYAVNGSIQTSDERQKTNISTSDLGLDFINKLNPVSYKWKVGGNDVEYSSVEDENIKLTPTSVATPKAGVRTHYGLIAQQVKEILGDKDFGGYVYDTETDTMSLRYDQFISPLIKAIQELKAENDIFKTCLGIS